MRIDYKCEKCAHKAICMYSDEVIKLISKLRNQCADELDHIHTLADINLIIDLDCPHYFENKPVERKFKPEPIDLPDIKFPSTIDTTLFEPECEGCIYKDQKNKLDYVGDSPCTWCKVNSISCKQIDRTPFNNTKFNSEED